MEKIKTRQQFEKDLQKQVRSISTPHPCYCCGQSGSYSLSFNRSGNVYPNARIYCNLCMEKLVRTKAETLYEKAMIVNRFSIESAVEELEKTGLPMMDPNVINVINTLSYNIMNGVDHYESKAEIKTAILLMLYGIPYKPAEKYWFNGRSCTIDFKLPEYKIILEIDGDLHALKNSVDTILRDIIILAKEGSEWEVIHVPTYIVDKYPHQLINVIYQAKLFLQKLRAENGYGQLPPKYLDQLSKLYEQILAQDK